MVLKLPSGQKQILWAFGNDIFNFFAIFWIRKLKQLSRKVRQSYLYENLVIGGFPEIYFKVTLRSKMNVLSVWNWHFSLFWKFLSDKLKPFSGEARQSVKYCSNLVTESFLENGIKAAMRSKKNVLNLCSWHFSVFANFWVTKLKTFSRRLRHYFQNFLYKV